ncbi:MAG: hypothetical protein AB7V50_01545, partial [Vampirovibrionia bacterium]
MQKKTLKKLQKPLWLVIGSIILCTGYLGCLMYTATTRTSSIKTNTLSTLIFIIFFFGLFIVVKQIDLNNKKKNIK